MYPAWSPDGASIALWHVPRGTSTTATTTQGRLVVVPSRRRRTRNPAVERCGTADFVVARRPLARDQSGQRPLSPRTGDHSCVAGDRRDRRVEDDRSGVRGLDRSSFLARRPAAGLHANTRRLFIGSVSRQGRRGWQADRAAGTPAVRRQRGELSRVDPRRPESAAHRRRAQQQRRRASRWLDGTRHNGSPGSTRRLVALAAAQAASRFTGRSTWTSGGSTCNAPASGRVAPSTLWEEGAILVGWRPAGVPSRSGAREIWVADASGDARQLTNFGGPAPGTARWF